MLILVLQLFERAGELAQLILHAVETHGEIAGIVLRAAIVGGTAKELRLCRRREEANGKSERENADGRGNHGVHSRARWKRQFVSPYNPRIPAFNIEHGVRPKWGFLDGARNQIPARGKNRKHT